MVIEYLVGSNFSERYQAQEAFDTDSEIITIENELHSHIEFSVVSNALLIYVCISWDARRMYEMKSVYIGKYSDVLGNIVTLKKSGTEINDCR